MTEEFTKVSIQLVDGPFATEGPWVSDLVVDPSDSKRAIAKLANTCFHVRMALGDTVALYQYDEDCWQVVDLLERNPELVSWAIYVVSQGEIMLEAVPDEMVYRARWVEVQHAIEEAAPDAIPYLKFEGALGMAPIVIAILEGAPQDVYERFEQVLTAMEAEYPITIYNHTDPEDLLDGGKASLMDEFNPEPMEPHDRIQTTYKAEDDPHWDMFEDEAPYMRAYVNRLASNDQRVATDLENGRYDRVMLFLERLFSDPQDIVPLDKPIWSD